MKRKSSVKKTTRPAHDFQVFKGNCENTMQAFGSPVMAHHEAHLIVRDDQANLAPGRAAVYAIYKRSENRILHIVRTAEALALPIAA
jgi:hypothetical protein